MSGIIKKIHFDHFRGTSGIDIDLRRLDIDQCPLPPGSTQLNIFAASDKCKKRTTEVSTFTFTFSSRQEYIRLDANNFQMMKFQMYVAKISKNHPSSTRFVGKKEKENPIIPFHDPFSLSTPNYRSVAVHRDPRAGIPSWKLSMHLQTWLLLSRHQIHQSILQWHRYRGRIRKVDDGEFPSFFFFFSLKHFRKNSIRVFFISQITIVENFICKKNPF